MTIKEEIEKRIEEIRQAAPKDEELAHRLEDNLHRYVLRQIAGSMLYLEEARELAELALTTMDIKFPRHFA